MRREFFPNRLLFKSLGVHPKNDFVHKMLEYAVHSGSVWYRGDLVAGFKCWNMQRIFKFLSSTSVGEGEEAHWCNVAKKCGTLPRTHSNSHLFNDRQRKQKIKEKMWKNRYVLKVAQLTLSKYIYFYTKFGWEWKRFKREKLWDLREIWRREMLSRNPDRIQKKFLVLRYCLIQL